MIAEKLLLALAIGFGYSFASVTTLATGVGAIVRRGLRGGLVAGSGTALGLSFYAAVAIMGLGLVQYFLRPVHLAIIEVAVGILFVATGIYLLVRRRHKRQRVKHDPEQKHERSLTAYFLTNLLLILSSPQKAAYITGMFLFFKLHITAWGVKAIIPFAVLAGSLLAWVTWTFIVAKGGRRLARSTKIQHGLHWFAELGHRGFCLAVRRFWVEKHMNRRLIKLSKLLLIVVGVVLVARGVWLFASWGFDPWSAGAIHG